VEGARLSPLVRVDSPDPAGWNFVTKYWDTN